MFNKNFYPTPKDIVSKMYYKLKREYITKILEPSAGKGDILDYIKGITDIYGRKPKLFAIEIEPELKNILYGKGYKILDNDFLNFESYSHFDAIIMNPPFDNGEKHLLKALELIKDGGQVVCLLNAETIKNPYSNDRKRLVAELERLNAEIEYLGNAFATAERKTNVDIAMVYVFIPFNPLESDIFKSVNFEARKRTEEVKEQIKDVVIFDELMQMIEDYNTEVNLYIQAYKSVEAFNSFGRLRDKDNDGIDLSHTDFMVGHKYGNKKNYDDILLDIRYRYWLRALKSSTFRKYLTQEVMQKVLETIEKQSEIEFTLKNILEIKSVLMDYFVDNLEAATINIFDKLTKCNYNDYSANIHYYSGWKTNKGSRLNKKIIVPQFYRKREIAEELEKVLNYFDAFKKYEPLKIDWYSPEAGVHEGEYFKCQIYIKGTMHIWFKRLDLLDKFNIFVGKKKNWLPDDNETVKRYQKDIVQHYKASDTVDTQINTSGVLMLEG